MLTAFCNAGIYTGKEILENKCLLIGEGRIKAIIDNGSIPPDAAIIDAAGHIIAPGLIDLQVYGGGGYLFSNDPSAAALQAMADGLVENGTTGFLLTLATNSMETFEQAIHIVRENPHPALMGLHFEGPYINPVKRGAHLIQHIKRPERKEVEKLLSAAAGLLKMVTLAPEVCDPEIITLFRDQGVIVSAGHSAAGFDEAMKGFANGITATTHLFNAMSPLHHRDTGLPGATFLSKDIPASIIADGIHVDYNTLSISKKLLNERLFLITDAVAEVRNGSYSHEWRNGAFVLPDGTLSGSGLTLLQAVKNCVQHAGIALDEALRMASLYPARLILADDTGKIEPDHKANLVIFDKPFTIVHTVIDGKIFNKPCPTAYIPVL